MGPVKATWYSAVAWTLITPVWAVGAFVLAVGFLAVPSVFLDTKRFVALGANAANKGRSLGPILHQTGPRIVSTWSRLVAASSRSIPFVRTRVTTTNNAGHAAETSREAKA